MTDPAAFRLEFAAEVWYWRGPSPFHFVTVPEEGSGRLREIANAVTYGWGMIPVHVRIGETTFDTSLFPKAGAYVVPLRDVVRRAERLEVGATVQVELRIRASGAPRGGRKTAVEYDLDHPPPDL